MERRLTSPDVLVVGGGIIGAACAHALATRGITVAIRDSGSESGIATQGSAGMLAPLAETGADDPLLGISVRGRDLYREVVPPLEEETGVAIGLWSDGILKVAFTEQEEDAIRHAIAWQRQQGLNSEWLPAGDLRERYPGLNPDIRGAMLAPEDGALEPLALLEGFLLSATRHGARLTRGERVERIERDEGRVTGVGTADGPIEAGAVLIAAGCWAGQIEGLPRPLSVEPVRGQMTAFDWPADEPGAIVYGPGGYVLRRGNELLAGSTMEHVGFDADVTETGQARIIEHATRLYPALEDATIRRRWAGLRPGTPDGRPIVGPDPEVSGLWYAAGHGRNGILLAAVTGEIIAHQFLGEDVEYDLSPVAPGRFWSS